MRNVIYVLVFLFALSAGSKTGSAQNTDPKERHQYVIAPRDFALPVIVAQPDSPLDFVETQTLINIDTRVFTPSFRLRNHGTKPIRSFTVATAGNSEWNWTAKNSGDYFLAGQIKTLEEDNRDEVVPLTDALRDRLKLSGSMKGFMVLLVVSVEYADGSVFHETGYEALNDYIPIISAALNSPCKPKSNSVPK